MFLDKPTRRSNRERRRENRRAYKRLKEAERRYMDVNHFYE